MRRRTLLSAALLLVAFTTAGLDGGWRTLFDGTSMDGWSLKAVHGGRGGVWTVADGALVADQDHDHTGGLLGTDEAFSDFELELQFKADYPVDSGIFLRTREDGMGYQVTLDLKEGGFVGSLYAPTAGDFLVQYPEWKNAFRADGWNHVRVRIEGQPPHIQAWLNGVQTLDFQDTQERYPREGYLGLQVHGGEGSWGETSKAHFRNVRIRPLGE